VIDQLERVQRERDYFSRAWAVASLVAATEGVWLFWLLYW